MTLTREILEILGLDLEDYSESSIDELLEWEGILQGSLAKIIPITCVTFERPSAACPDYAISARQYTLIADMLFRGIHNICFKLNLVDEDYIPNRSTFFGKEYKLPSLKHAKEYEKVIKGVIELREKKERPHMLYGLVSCKPEGAEIPDWDLGQYNSPKNVIEILRERYIKRLENLFKEQESEGKDND